MGAVFVPYVVETFGGFAPVAVTLNKKISTFAEEHSITENRDDFMLKSKSEIAFAVQYGNYRIATKAIQQMKVSLKTNKKNSGVEDFLSALLREEKPIREITLKPMKEEKKNIDNSTKCAKNTSNSRRDDKPPAKRFTSNNRGREKPPANKTDGKHQERVQNKVSGKVLENFNTAKPKRKKNTFREPKLTDKKGKKRLEPQREIATNSSKINTVFQPQLKPSSYKGKLGNLPHHPQSTLEHNGDGGEDNLNFDNIRNLSEGYYTTQSFLLISAPESFESCVDSNELATPSEEPITSDIVLKIKKLIV